MPQKAINYSNTIIYKLVSNDLNFKSCYVGHTTDMTHRKQKHKSCCNNENNEDYHTKK
jgi:predicted GIY-YIG superfamily endonuclease